MSPIEIGIREEGLHVQYMRIIEKTGEFKDYRAKTGQIASITRIEVFEEWIRLYLIYITTRLRGSL